MKSKIMTKYYKPPIPLMTNEIRLKEKQPDKTKELLDPEYVA
jgi:hypothetical protein